jgi:hypothetical protein
MKHLLVASLVLASLSQFNFTGTALAQSVRQWDFPPGGCPTNGYLPEPARTEQATPAYYFPARPTSFGQVEFPAAIIVSRVPCAAAPHAEIRLTVAPLPGRTVIFPRVQVIQRGIDYGCAGLEHGATTSIPGWPGVCRDFIWEAGAIGGAICDSPMWCITPEQASLLRGKVSATLASRALTTSFDPDHTFTLRISRGGTQPDANLIYEIPARGTPGNVHNTPQAVAGLWWNPAQPGWGMLFDRNERGVLFASWLTFDDTGKSTWFVMPNGQESEPGVISGAVHAVRGQPFSQPAAPDTVAGEIVGQFRFTFRTGDVGEFRYTVNGRSGTAPIERFVMRSAQGAVCGANARGVLEVTGVPGWAANVEGSQGYSTTCGTHASLLTYDDAGKPMWVYGSLLPNIPRPDDITANSALYGALYRPSGTPYGLAWDANRFASGAPVGTWDSSYANYFNPQPLNRVTVDIGGVKRVLGFKRFQFEF